MLNTLTIEPTRITAGDTIQWSRSVPDYPATSGWVLNYSLLSLAGSIQISTVPDGSSHLVNIPMSVSAGYVPGTYSWQSWVTNGSERHQIEQGTIEVLVDFATAGAGTDTRSHVKRTLDSIEAVIEGRASKGDQELTIDGTTLKKMNVEELLKLRSTYFNLYRQELNAIKRSSGAGSARVRQVIPR